jgi:hypothetical protein
MDMNKQIEQERAEIVRVAAAKMRADGLQVSRASLAEFIERDYVGFGLNNDDDIPDVTVAKEADVPSSPLDRQALLARSLELDQACATIRVKIEVLLTQRAKARAVLAAAIGSWTSGLPAVSAESVTREFLAASVAERQQAKESGRSVHPSGAFGRSKLDRSAAYARSGDPAERRLQVGHSRGAYPASARGRKVPSQA